MLSSPQPSHYNPLFLSPSVTLVPDGFDRAPAESAAFLCTAPIAMLAALALNSSAIDIPLEHGIQWAPALNQLGSG